MSEENGYVPAHFANTPQQNDDFAGESPQEGIEAEPESSFGGDEELYQGPHDNVPDAAESFFAGDEVEQLPLGPEAEHASYAMDNAADPFVEQEQLPPQPEFDPAGDPPGIAMAPVAEEDLGLTESSSHSVFGGILDFVVAFVGMVAVFMLLRIFVIEPFKIPSGSMLQTIQLEDRVLAEKISVAIDHMPTPGEIVTFTNPRDASQTLIKRVIAIEGQTIDFIDGIVYVDGVALDEPYTNGQATRPMRCDGRVQKTDIVYPYTIPEGCFWAMGDNRGNSSDSRVFGPVKASSVTGHAVFRYWPFYRVDSSGNVTLSFGPLE